MEEKAESTEEVEWLRTIPGIGLRNAVLILGELGEVTRFSSPQGFVCYAGLASAKGSAIGRPDTVRPYQPAEQ